MPHMANLPWMFTNVLFNMTLILMYSASMLENTTTPAMKKNSKDHKNKKWLW